MLNGFAFCRMIFEDGSPKDFVYLDVNKAFIALTGLKNVLGKKVSEVIPGIRESDPALFETYGRVSLTGKPEVFETFVEALKMWFSISVYSPRKEYFVAVFEVITERKHAEEKVRRLNRTYAVLSNINHLIVRERDRKGLLDQACQIAVEQGKFGLAWIGLLDDKTRLLKPVASAGLGNTFVKELESSIAGESVGTGPTAMALRSGEVALSNDIRHDSRKIILRSKMIEHGFRSLASLPLRCADKTIGTVSFYAKELQFFDEEEITLLSELATDLSFALETLDAEDSRKQMLEALGESEESQLLLTKALESTANGIMITDLKGNIVWVNKAFTTMTGYSWTEVIGQNPRILKSGTQDDAFYKNLWKTISAGNVWTGELVNKRKNGSVYIDETTITPLRNKNGEITNFIAVKQDITDRRRMEDALLYEQGLLRAIMDNMPDHVYFKDKQSRFLRISKSQASQFGLNDPAMAIGKTDFDFFSDGHAGPAFEDEKTIMESGIAIVGAEEKELWRDGRETWVSTTKVPLQDAQGNVMGTFGISRDITARKNAERALRESEERYRSFFERNLAATFVSTSDGEILECNPAFRQMFGIQSDEQARSTNLNQLYADRKNREVVLATLVVQEKCENVQLRMIKLDGAPMYVIANLVGKLDEQGRLVQETGYLIDDTKRHRLENELIQSQKLESLGILAGGIAHDFNNILGILMGHISLIERIRDDPELHKTSLESIDKALKRGSALVRQLLTFARKSDVEFGPVFVNDIIKEVLRLIRETFPKTIEIATELGSEIPAIVADGSQIHQVLLNLCVNARDAMPAGGTIRIRTRIVEEDLVRQRFPNAPSEKFVALEVQDSGTGMDETTKTRIFEPFFTTKESGKGTGLGLAVVFGIVQTHKGYINVESALGAGSTFRIYLPAETASQSGAMGQKIKIEQSLGGLESILIAEDEALLFETTKMALVSKGYKVFYAKDGLEALELYRQHHREIALVLTDMDLPRLGGEGLIKSLLEVNPKLRIIFSSGFVEPEVKTRVLDLGAKAFLAKPYEPSRMLALVRDVLDAKD